MLFMYFALLENPEDEPLFETFYNKFYNTIFYICKDHLKTREDAEDCAQEILVTFAKNFHNMSHDFDSKRLHNFIRVVSKGRAIDAYRKEKKHYENLVETPVDEFFNISTNEFDVVDEITLIDAFNEMPEEYRYVSYLKYVFNMSGKEIGEYMNLSQPYVRKKCMQGRMFIKAYFEGEDNKKSN